MSLEAGLLRGYAPRNDEGAGYASRNDEDRASAGVAMTTRAKKIWRDFTPDAQAADIKIGIIASFTVASLTSMIGAALLDAKIKPYFAQADYNQVIQTCLHYPASFQIPLDACIILWRMEDLAYENVIPALTHLRTVFTGTLIVAIPPFPQTAPLDNINIALEAGQQYRTFIQDFLKQIATIPNVRLLDLDALQRDFGAQASIDLRQWYLYKQPYTEAFLWKMGAHLARMLQYPHVPPKKALLLDCDNTLWGGVVGEEGLNGIQIGPEGFPGNAFYDFQQYIVSLSQQGVLLALVSKNNEQDVWEVFDKHDGMLLKREHIAAYRINWQAKSLNIQAIADELNIKLDSLVFVDDNPVEIAEICTTLPQVATHLLSDDPATYVHALQQKHYFEKWDRTEEDTKRTEMIRAERQRDALRQTISFEAFIASLELKIEIAKALPSQLERVTQLINKTNQFNFSSKRYTLEAIQALANQENWEILTLRLSDKFGDYGLVGVALIKKEAVWHIDTLLLSCRALGRGVESVFLDYIVQQAKKAHVHTLTADFVLTDKNAPAAAFLDKTHFKKAKESYTWLLN